MCISAIVGGASILGSVLGSKSNNKAINNATDAQSQGNREALQYMRESRGENNARLDPFITGGLQAFNARNALLGLNDNSVGPVAQQQNTNALLPSGAPGGQAYAGSPIAGIRAGEDLNNSGGFNVVGGRSPGFGFSDGQFNNALSPQPNVQQAVGAPSQQTAEGAFDTFRNSTGYQFRLNEGLDAVNSGYAGAGTLQSGAAMKGINEYGQNFASNEFGNYMGYLGDQAGMGYGAAGAAAGVSTNFANSAANLAQQNGNNLANAAVAKANNNNALYGGIASGIGTIFGGL